MRYLDMYVQNRFVKENVFLKSAAENKALPIFEYAKEILPEPFWEGHDRAISCYWKAWELAFKNLRKPTSDNGFVTNYIDTAFNDCLFMWDSSFILIFARYGKRAFEFQKTLDNLYAKQHEDGFICREIREMDGKDQFHRFDVSSTGPNIMPLTEWEYYLNYNDKARLEKVFPVLAAYHLWLKEFRTWTDGSYWSTGWGCGMDNTPRLEEKYHESFSHGHMIWVDTCIQQILSAKLLLKMSDVIGRRQEMQEFEEEIALLSDLVNRKLWDDDSAFYYDLWKSGELNHVKSIGAYWALLADIVPENQKERFISHLSNENEFNRPHPIPTLSADHPAYQQDGGYWRGGVWAPTNYMVLKGLHTAGYDALAHEIATKHLDYMTMVYESTGTIWENYSPEHVAPGNPAKPDFVGWSGITPIAVLFEYVFGLKPNVPHATLEWDVRLLDAHGISRYPYGNDGILDLRCEKRTSPKEKPVITAKANIPVTLVVRWEGGKESLKLG
ncbi:MGH1-like glycoside hydrolase domain-containing protein [Cohnella sp. JJ-181]|uniref:MGH1-like glycoside hydrolase domain-containing protein n=1 Tax=Cohnella rhizoplanae TaxID=2974897 RepID=UPI0022FF8A59|nr:trehalase family glycosidase [Cohnella sp. JJ-181]CAI6043615.1 Cytoplasmic trehalase [Cohnella sp. JJ-181]